MKLGCCFVLFCFFVFCFSYFVFSQGGKVILIEMAGMFCPLCFKVGEVKVLVEKWCLSSQHTVWQKRLNGRLGSFKCCSVSYGLYFHCSINLVSAHLILFQTVCRSNSDLFVPYKIQGKVLL